MGQNNIITFFFAPKKNLAEGKKPSAPKELELGPRSGLYLLVIKKVHLIQIFRKLKEMQMFHSKTNYPKNPAIQRI